MAAKATISDSGGRRTSGTSGATRTSTSPYKNMATMMQGEAARAQPLQTAFNRAATGGAPTQAASPAPSPLAPRAASPAPRVGASYSSASPLVSSGTGVVSTAEEVPTTSPSTPQDFEAWKSGGGQVGDSVFAAEDASAEAELNALLSQLAQQNTNYMTDFKGGLRSLGWKYQGDDYGNGAWDPSDTLTSYGQNYQNMQNDYSGRGLMDSTFYQGAVQDMQRRFDQSRTDAVNGLATQQSQYTQNQAQGRAAREAARNRALASAYQRYTANYGV